LFYQGIVAAMAVELSYDVLRAAQITRQLLASEAELREEHQRMDLATAAAKLGIWMWDIVRNEVWISEEGRVLFGFAPSEKLDIDRFRNAIHPDDRDSMRRAVENSLSTGVEYEAEHRVLLPGGQVRWLAGRGRVELDTDGKPVRMRGVSADVTKRKMGDEALRESEARIKLAANAANLGLWIWDIPGDERWVTGKWRQLFGFVDSEPVTLDRFLQIVHPGDRERVKQVVQHVLEHGGEYEIEYRITRPDGSKRWILGHGSVELDERGKPALARGVARDITKRKIAEEDLRESEERFRTVANAAPVMIWMSGPDKLCTFFNKGWLEFTGRSLEQELGNGWAEGVHPDDLQRCLKTYTEAFDARQPFVMRYRLRRHDGEYRWVSDNGVPRYDGQKNFAGYIGSCIDITESLSKEESLREFEERVTLAAQAAHLGVWELDTATNEMWMSDSARALFQLDSEAQVSAAALQDRVHPEDRARRDSAVKAAIETQGEYEIEYRIVLPDGTLRWIGGRGRCVPKQDRGTRLIGVSMDITTQKQTQDLFRLATEASPSGVILVDHGGLIVLVNSHAEELFGYSREELIGKVVDILVPERFASHHPDHRARFLAAPTTRAMGAGRELFARRKDGSEFPVEIGLNPIQTPQGPLVLANVVDISARVAGEEEARRRREQVELLSRVSLLGEMTASLAHEVNQPLAAIMNNATAATEYIKQGRLDPKQLQEILTDVIGDSRRAHDIIHNVRSAIKKGSAIRGRINLNDVAKAVTHMVHPDAAANFCRVEMSLAPDLPVIEGDPIQIQQVLINLVRNAFDAMRDTSPSRRIVEIATNSNGDGTISVAVRDYGCGISEKTREHLFEQFFTTKEEGLGMGLAIVRSIVEAHGGTIGAENADGGGARFHFRLPAKEGTLQ
jgi:PAS domain S-box-containing protein